MIIKSIELRNFRNYENLDIHLDEGTNILYGDNAQGKTNILEAAYLTPVSKDFVRRAVGPSYFSEKVSVFTSAG